MKILIADDQPIILKILDYKLGNSGYDIVSCKDGNSARTQFDNDQFGMVISDIMMPESDGLELLNHIRHTRNSNVPVIIMTDLLSESKELEAKRIGATEFIRKPLDINYFITLIKSLSNKN